MEYKERIIKWTENNRDFIIKTLADLIKIPSVSGLEGELMKKIKEIYYEMGYNPREVIFERNEMKKHGAYIDTTELGCPFSYEGRPNIIITKKGTGDGKSLILNAHCDTINVENEKSWKYPPFSAKIHNGRLYGRGAADTKSGVVEAIAIFKMLKDLNLSLKGDLTIQNVIEEEAGGNGTLQCVMDGQKADGAIILENVGEGLIVAAARGVHFFEIIISGKPTMMEYLWNEINTIDIAIRIYEAVRDYNLVRNSKVKHPLYDMYPREMPKAPIAITMINGGILPGTTPEFISLKGSAECLPNESLKQMRNELKNFLKKTMSTDPVLKDARLKIKWWGMRMESTKTDINHKIVEVVKKSNKEIFNIEPMLVGAGGCDLRLLNIHAETPGILYGPNGENAHGIDENVEIDSLLNTFRALALAIIDFCRIS